MKRLLGVLAILLISSLLLAETLPNAERPWNGLYVSSADGATLDDVPVPYVPYARLGVDSERHIVRWVHDQDGDGDLMDEEVYTYPAQFYPTYIQFSDGVATSLFVFDTKRKEYVLATNMGGRFFVIKFTLIERW